MFMNIINDALGGDDSEVFPIPKGINDLLLPEEFIQKLSRVKEEKTEKEKMSCFCLSQKRIFKASWSK